MVKKKVGMRKLESFNCGFLIADCGMKGQMAEVNDFGMITHRVDSMAHRVKTAEDKGQMTEDG